MSGSATISARCGKFSTISIRISCWSGATTSTRISSEDIVPPFCVLGYDPEFDLQPWAANSNGANGTNGAGKPNRWGEPGDWRLPLKGHREAAKHIATGLIERGIDLAYAYKPLHHPMAHAFTNTFLYIDWDRRGFPYPVVPFAINCYGRNLIHAKGGLGHLFGAAAAGEARPATRRRRNRGA